MGFAGAIYQCEICGQRSLNNYCMRKKAHTKIKKLTSLYGDDTVKDAIFNAEKVKEDKEHLEASDTFDMKNYDYTKLVMVYYVRFQEMHNWCSSMTFETYFSMLLNSCKSKFGDSYDELVEKYGLQYGLEDGKTHVFSHEGMRLFENSLFLVYTLPSNEWMVQLKGKNKSTKVPFTMLRKSSQEEFVMGYVLRVAQDLGWMGNNTPGSTKALHRVDSVHKTILRGCANDNVLLKTLKEEGAPTERVAFIDFMCNVFYVSDDFFALLALVQKNLLSYDEPEPREVLLHIFEEIYLDYIINCI